MVFSDIGGPLTQSLKKNAFAWIHRSQEAFEALKCVISLALVLGLQDFSKQFVVESEISHGALLMQEGSPINFCSQALPRIVTQKSAYEIEPYALGMVVQKWSLYLIYNPSIVLQELLGDRRLVEAASDMWVWSSVRFSAQAAYRLLRD